MKNVYYCRKILLAKRKGAFNAYVAYANTIPKIHTLLSWTLLGLLFPAMALAQGLQGTILEAASNQPVQDANVSIRGSLAGTVSDEAGRFSLNNIAPGDYVLSISKVGFETLELEVSVSQADTDLGTVSLQPGIMLLNKEVVVTAQRMPQLAYESPQASSVLNQSQLEQYAPRSAAEALLGLPGVWVQKTNHGGGSPFIRGMTGNQALQMIDGIRLNNAISRYGPNQYFNTIDPNSIQQIEVTRGAGSVPYGSDAMGGVIQVFTKSPTFSDGFRLSGNAYGKLMSSGMEQSGRGEIEVSGSRAAFYGGFSLRHFGDLIAGGGRKQSPSSYGELSSDMKALFRLSSRQRLTLAYQFLDQKDVYRWDQTALQPWEPPKRTLYQTWQFDPQDRRLGYMRWEMVNNNRWIRQLTATTSLNRSVEGRIKQRQNENLLQRERDAVNTYGGILEVRSAPAAFYSITSGLEYYYDRVRSQATETDMENNTVTEKRGAYPASARAASLAIFTLHTLDFARLTLTYGGRINTFRVTSTDPTFGNIDNSPTAIVGNVAASYAVWPSLRVVASLNTGFRAPNIDDLTKFGSFDSGFEVPISGLSPEKSLTVETGIKTKTEYLSGSLLLYRTCLSDLIARVPATFRGSDMYDGFPVYRKQNVDNSYIQGIEAETEVTLTNQFIAFGSLIYTYGQNVSSNEPMRRIPPLNGRLGLQYYQGKGWIARAEWLFAGRQDRLSGGDLDDHRISPTGTPGWHVVNVYAGYTYDWFSVHAGLQNLTDTYYRMHGSGVDGYGRSVWVAARARF